MKKLLYALMMLITLNSCSKDSEMMESEVMELEYQDTVDSAQNSVLDNSSLGDLPKVENIKLMPINSAMQVNLPSAMNANLLSLRNTDKLMSNAQNRLSTGNKVNSALDNPSSFFTYSALWNFAPTVTGMESQN